MRRMLVDTAALRGAQRDLDSARDDVRKALSRIEHPEDDFPFRDLMVHGVKELIEDAELAARRCRRIRDGIQDAIDDVSELDQHLHDAARRTVLRHGGHLSQDAR